MARWTIFTDLAALMESTTSKALKIEFALFEGCKFLQVNQNKLKISLGCHTSAILMSHALGRAVGCHTSRMGMH